MRIYRDGKEVKEATVVYSGMTGEPVRVVVKGETFSATLFELKDEESKKRTKPAARTKKVSDEIMTTKNTGVKKK